MTKLNAILMVCALAGMAADVAAASVNGPRPLAEQTAQAVIRDYLQSWRSLSAALNENRPDLLNADFVGDARDKLAQAIREQSKMAVRTHYEDRAHDVQIIFYSPEGMSIELSDTVDYDVQLTDHDKPMGTQHMHARYLVVLTPSELRWRVRILQAEAS